MTVDGLHSADFSADRRSEFLLTIEMKGVKTTSFFDSFSSFPGWCSVRGSSQVTLRIARWRREGWQGSIAKRWSRRTRRYVGGKIESRGVKLVYPVGGKPGARAKIARSGPQG